jgi:hypothetical protein
MMFRAFNIKKYYSSILLELQLKIKKEIQQRN